MDLIFAEAPSNIALIKYMGKVPQGRDTNRPLNESISLTLPELRSRVEIHPSKVDRDQWEPLSLTPWAMASLSEQGQLRYLSHFQRLKAEWKIDGHYLVRSGNNFPSDCGVASSASSFAALTLATFRLAQSQGSSKDLSMIQLADWSRQGSGSSCRSFGDPFVRWGQQNQIEELSFPMEFSHELLLLDAHKKEVSSSEAHRRVASSSMFVGRAERASQRYQDLVSALRSGDWDLAWQITWDETWDMHNLFHTSQPPFVLMTQQSFAVLEFLRHEHSKNPDMPLVTMDAGANVHLIYKKGMASLWSRIQNEFPHIKMLVGRK
jgi:diphosphomevalonate decarboxylase